MASLACLMGVCASVDLSVAGGNEKIKRPKACAWIDGEMTTVFRTIKFINSFVKNKGNSLGRVLIQIETDAGVFKVSSIFVRN